LGQRDSVLGADLNGDGAVDLLSGAPKQARAYLNYGPLLGDLQAGDSDVVVSGADDGFGQSPAAADLDGDGYPELVLGALGELDGSGQSVGATHLFVGSAGAWSATLSSSASSSQFLGLFAGDETGSAHAIGDVDGDGELDLLLGQVGQNGDAGAAHLFLGPLTPGQFDVGDADASFYGEDTGRCGGLGSLAIEDMDSDGLADVLMACPQYGEAQQGAVHFFFGQTE
jgi:hypothetical protein